MFKRVIEHNDVYMYQDDHISNHVITYGEWEPHISEIICKFYVQGTDILDIGANIGLTTLGVAKRINIDGIFHLFEPYPMNFELLCQNTKNITNKNLYNVCLSNSNGLVNFTKLDNNLGGCKVVENIKDSEFSCCSIPLDCINFDNKISIIKLDVEGHEENVIIGGRNTILKHKPVILFEVWGHLYETTHIFKLLNSLGYNIHHISFCDYIAIPS